MDKRRAAGALLALTACIACSAAAPTASNQTGLDLYDAATEGCYYNFQHYGEGDRIMTNEPCLNCTCHNRMLMCYLRVCPFTKPIGQDCTVEKRADQCCPIVTCPDVPVDLLTSTSTTSPAEYGATGLGKLDKYGCSINGRYFPEGSKVPPSPNKPCEHCYCIRNMTTCVMQECTLHVDGCTPIYHKDVCCPVRYSCDHPEDEVPLLDDMSTTVRPTPGFLLTTTTVAPVTQMTQDCIHDDKIFPDGTSIKTEKACEHCYCMKGDIVCVVQECGTPMENEGKNCTSQPPREGQCCPDTYICEGDEPVTDISSDLTTQLFHEELTTLSPPRRVSDEDNGYRNEPDEAISTEKPIEESEIGSGDNEQVTMEPLDEEEKQTALFTDDTSAVTEKVIEPEHGSTTTHVPILDLEKATTEPDKEMNTVPSEIETSKQDDHEQSTYSSLFDKDHEISTHTTEPTYRKEDDLPSEISSQDKDKESTTSEDRQKTTIADLLSEKETESTASTEAGFIQTLATTKAEEIKIVSTSETTPSDIEPIEDTYRTTETQEIIPGSVETTTADIFKTEKESTKVPQTQEITTEPFIEMTTSIIESGKETTGTTHILKETTISDVSVPAKESDDTNEYAESTTSLPVETTALDSSTISTAQHYDKTSVTKEVTTGSPQETTSSYDVESKKESVGTTPSQDITTEIESKLTSTSVDEHAKETVQIVEIQDKTTTPTIVSEFEKDHTDTASHINEEPTTFAPNKNDFATIDTQENEIVDFTTQGPGRIPGEGDCLLDGITYGNESVVPSTNKCQTECKCISSIIKCDPIICSSPPEYMNNCVPTYDSPESCCPTYICDESHETIPPQAHSQMSGTESPIPTHTTECRGDQCEIQKEQKPHEPICTSDDCSIKPDDKLGASDCGSEDCSNIDQSQPQKPDKEHTDIDQQVIPDCGETNCDGINQKVPPISTEICTGVNCNLPTSQQPACDDGKDCQPTEPCEGEKCQIIPIQLCGDGEKCQETLPEIQKPCEGDACSSYGGCDTSDCGAPSVDKDQQLCQGDDCHKAEEGIIEDCTEEPCRRKTVPSTENKLPTECNGVDCDQQKPDLSQQPEKDTTTTISQLPELSSVTTSEKPAMETVFETIDHTSTYPTKDITTEAETTEKSELATEIVSDSPAIVTLLPGPSETESPEIHITEKTDIQSTTESKLPERHFTDMKIQDESSSIQPEITLDKETPTDTTGLGITDHITETSFMTEQQEVKTESPDVSRYATSSSTESVTSDTISVTKIPDNEKLSTSEPTESIGLDSQYTTESSMIDDMIGEEETQKPIVPTTADSVTKYPEIVTEKEIISELPVTKPEETEEITEKVIVTEEPKILVTEVPKQDTTEILITEIPKAPVSEVEESSKGPEENLSTVEETETEKMLFEKETEKPEYNEQKQPEMELASKPGEEITEKDTTVPEVDVTESDIKATTEQSPKDLITVTPEPTKLEEEYVTLGTPTKKPDEIELPQTELTISHTAETESPHLPDIYVQSTEAPGKHDIDDHFMPPTTEQTYEPEKTATDDISEQTTLKPVHKKPIEEEQVTDLPSMITETQPISTEKSTITAISEDRSETKPPEKTIDDDTFTESPEIDTEEPTIFKVDEMPMMGPNNDTFDLESPDYIPVHPSTVSQESEEPPEKEPTVTEISLTTNESKRPELEIISQQIPDQTSPVSEESVYESPEITTIKSFIPEQYTETISSELEKSTTSPEITLTEQEQTYTKSPETAIDEDFITKAPVSDTTLEEKISDTDVSHSKDEVTDNEVISTTEKEQTVEEEKEKDSVTPDINVTEQEITTKVPDLFDHKQEEPEVLDKEQEEIVTKAEDIPIVKPISESDAISTEQPELLTTESHDFKVKPDVTTPKEQKLATELPQELTTRDAITVTLTESLESSTTTQPSYTQEHDILDVTKPDDGKETAAPQSHIKETEEHTTIMPELIMEPEVQHTTEAEKLQPIPPATDTTEKSEILGQEPQMEKHDDEIKYPGTDQMSTDKPKTDYEVTKIPEETLHTDTTMPDIVELVEHTETVLEEISTKSPLDENLIESSQDKSTTEQPGYHEIDQKYPVKEEPIFEKPQQHEYEPEVTPEEQMTTLSSMPIVTDSEQKHEVENEFTTLHSTSEQSQEIPTTRPLLQEIEQEQNQDEETSTPLSLSPEIEPEIKPSETYTTEQPEIYEDEHKSSQPTEISTTRPSEEEKYPDKISETYPSTQKSPDEIPVTTELNEQFTNEIPTTLSPIEQSPFDISTSISSDVHLPVEATTRPSDHSLDEVTIPVEQIPDKATTVIPSIESDIITTKQPVIDQSQTSTTYSSAEHVPSEISTIHPSSVDHLSEETATTISPIERLPHEDFTTSSELEQLPDESVTTGPSDGQKQEEPQTTILPLESTTAHPIEQQTEFGEKIEEESSSPIPEIKEKEPIEGSGDEFLGEKPTTEQPELDNVPSKIPTSVSLDVERVTELAVPTGLPETTLSHETKQTDKELFTTISETGIPDEHVGTTSSNYLSDKSTSPSVTVEEITSSSPTSVSQEEIEKQEDEEKLEEATTASPTYSNKEENVTSIISDKLSTTTQSETDINLGTEKPVEYDHSHDTTEAEGEFLPASTKATTPKTEEEPTTQAAIFDKTTKSEEKISEVPSTAAPEIPKPGLNEIQPPDEVAEPDDHEDHEGPSASGGYGTDYADDDQPFGPGTCRYGGKVYVSAQQIPRDDPCDFCFCFRSDIICLQQSCPPPIHGCHEEPIQGFCCPRYECPVSMATALNVTTTTTTTTTTLPPHFLPHAYKGAAYKRGCQIKGHTYKVGEVVRASSGPCLHCTCGGDGQMKCDPKACTPEPMLRQMIAAAVSAKRRR
ncbi:uncharacterized protein ACR2FA_002320 [Aphomia sociella]